MSLVLTVDVEDWAQSTIDPDFPITDRARRNTEFLLDLLAEHRRKVTCFVLGKFAERFPECVTRIVRDGHELSSHGYGHVPVSDLSPERFRADIRRSKTLLEDIAGAPVLGYRAPCFSVTPETAWALDIIEGEGFVYDSSINPARKPGKCVNAWPVHPVNLRTPNGGVLCELPAATLDLLGRSWTVAGGGYHRLLPLPLIRWLIQRSMSRGHAFIAYCHPYEFDPREFTEVDYRIPLILRLHQGIGRKRFQSKFRGIMKVFDSTTAIELVRARQWPEMEGIGNRSGPRLDADLDGPVGRG